VSTGTKARITSLLRELLCCRPLRARGHKNAGVKDVVVPKYVVSQLNIFLSASKRCVVPQAVSISVIGFYSLASSPGDSCSCPTPIRRTVTEYGLNWYSKLSPRSCAGVVTGTIFLGSLRVLVCWGLSDVSTTAPPAESTPPEPFIVTLTGWASSAALTTFR
jgi:hypothetical protein